MVATSIADGKDDGAEPFPLLDLPLGRGFLLLLGLPVPALVVPSLVGPPLLISDAIGKLLADTDDRATFGQGPPVEDSAIAAAAEEEERKQAAAIVEHSSDVCCRN